MWNQDGNNYLKILWKKIQYECAQSYEDYRWKELN